MNESTLSEGRFEQFLTKVMNDGWFNIFVEQSKATILENNNSVPGRYKIYKPEQIPTNP